MQADFFKMPGGSAAITEGKKTTQGAAQNGNVPGEPDIHSVCIRLRDHRHQQYQEPLPPETRRLQSLQGTCNIVRSQQSLDLVFKGLRTLCAKLQSLILYLRFTICTLGPTYHFHTVVNDVIIWPKKMLASGSKKHVFSEFQIIK